MGKSSVQRKSPSLSHLPKNKHNTVLNYYPQNQWFTPFQGQHTYEINGVEYLHLAHCGVPRVSEVAVVSRGGEGHQTRGVRRGSGDDVAQVHITDVVDVHGILKADSEALGKEKSNVNLKGDG